VLKAVRSGASGISAGEAGQASAETTGLVVLVAVLFAGLAMWIPGAIDLPDDPPPFIERIGAALGVSAPSLDAHSTTNPAIWQFVDHGNDNEPIGNFLRRARDVAVRTSDLEYVFAMEFSDAARDGARDRAVHIVRHPLGALIEMIPRPQNVSGQAIDGLASAYALSQYLDELRAMSSEEATRKIARDTGEQVGAGAVDALITRSLRAAGRRVSGPGAGPAPTDAEPDGPGANP
jgi:hypothetical protein